MGIKCTCLKEISIDETSLRFDFSKSISISESSEVFSLNDIILLQGVLRGFIDRHKSKALSNNYRNSRSKTFKKQPNPDLGKVLSTDVCTKAIDYKSRVVQNTQKKLGPFLSQKLIINALRKSRGPVLLSNNAIYIGEWNDSDHRDGYGMQIWPECSIYEGTWKDDSLLKGRLIFENGDAYEGEFLNNKALGKGILYHNEGGVYNGEWVGDKKHGLGQEVSSNGLKYSGEFYDDKKHGKGLMVFEDSSEYDGEFFEDLIQGFGKFVWIDGREYLGEWVNGKMQGKGIFTWKDGRKYEGEYFQDQKHGFGKFVDESGGIYEGYWVKGKKHGFGMQSLKYGLQRKGEWEDGRRIRWVIQ